MNNGVWGIRQSSQGANFELSRFWLALVGFSGSVYRRQRRKCPATSDCEYRLPKIFSTTDFTVKRPVCEEACGHFFASALTKRGLLCTFRKIISDTRSTRLLYTPPSRYNVPPCSGLMNQRLRRLIAELNLTMLRYLSGAPPSRRLVRLRRTQLLKTAYEPCGKINRAAMHSARPA